LLRGYQRQQKRREVEEVEAWRRTRFLGTLLVNINRAEKTPAISPEELFFLPGDPPPPEPMSLEEFDAIIARLGEFDTLQTVPLSASDLNSLITE
jgi:hypothetical protein